MRIHNLNTPFPHTIIYDYYSPRESSLILQELHSLRPVMKDKTGTGDPRSSNMVGLSLDWHYQADRSKSHILNFNRQIFNLTDKLKENKFMTYLDMVNEDLTQINYYPDGSEYLHHADHAVISAVSTFWESPKTFEGGKLFFKEYDYSPYMENNTVVLFPSFEQHEVTKVKGHGRYSINQFFFVNR